MPSLEDIRPDTVHHLTEGMIQGLNSDQVSMYLRLSLERSKHSSDALLPTMRDSHEQVQKLLLERKEQLGGVA